MLYRRADPTQLPYLAKGKYLRENATVHHLILRHLASTTENGSAQLLLAKLFASHYAHPLDPDFALFEAEVQSRLREMVEVFKAELNSIRDSQSEDLERMATVTKNPSEIEKLVKTHMKEIASFMRDRSTNYAAVVEKVLGPRHFRPACSN